MLSKEQKTYVNELVNKVEEQQVDTFTRSFLYDGIVNTGADIDTTADLLFRLGILVKVSPRKYAFDKHALANVGQLSSKQNRWMDVIETHYANEEFMMARVNTHLTPDEAEWSPVILEELVKLEYIEKVSDRKYKLSKTREDDEEDSKRVSIQQPLSIQCMCGNEKVRLLNTFYKKGNIPVTLLCPGCSRTFSYPSGSDVYRYVVSLL